MATLAGMRSSFGGISCLLGAVLLCSAGWSHGQTLWYEDQQRLNVGMKLFPAFLAADQTLDERVAADGRALVLVVHDDQPASARNAAAALRAAATDTEHPLRVETVAPDGLAAFSDEPVAGIFVATPGMDAGLFSHWAKRYRALVFSPFSGDVERGAVAGIYVSDRILPYVNERQAERAGIRFKPFFLQVVRLHE